MLRVVWRGLPSKACLYYPALVTGANILQTGALPNRCLSYSSYGDEEDPRPQFKKYRGEKQHDPLHRRSLSDVEKREMYALYRDPEDPASVEYLSQK